MTIEIACFVFGGLLLFVGLVGGGFEIKELKVPKVGIVVRVLPSVVGVLFVLVGIGLKNDIGHSPPPPPASATPVDFVLSDHLGEGQISEQVTVLIDGRSVGNLTVNRDYPESAITITVPKAGQHSYTAEATAYFDVQGQALSYTGVGQGMIDVQPGRTYSLRGSVSGNTWLVSIMQE